MINIFKVKEITPIKFSLIYIQLNNKDCIHNKRIIE